MIHAMARTDSGRGDVGGGYARAVGIGFTLVAILALLSGIGFLVDRLLGTIPLFLLVGLFAGFAGGLYYVYVVLNKMGNG